MSQLLIIHFTMQIEIQMGEREAGGGGGGVGFLCGVLAANTRAVLLLGDIAYVTLFGRNCFFTSFT